MEHIKLRVLVVILKNKYISKSNTVNNMKLMILEKIRVLNSHIMLLQPRAASMLSVPNWLKAAT